jgi:hypothetical protein
MTSSLLHCRLSPLLLRLYQHKSLDANMCYACRLSTLCHALVSTSLQDLEHTTSSECACDLCSNGDLVRDAYIQRTMNAFLRNPKAGLPTDFECLDNLLRMFSADATWFHHLASKSETFTLICNGMYSSHTILNLGITF